MVVLGRIAGSYGVRGEVRVESYTRPLDNLAGHKRWWLEQQGCWREYRVAHARPHGKGLVAALGGVADRGTAHELLGSAIAVPREQLPEPAADEVYWADLVGLRVVTTAGEALGVVSHLIETGSNDVLVVRGDRERLVPFVSGVYVLDVDFSAAVIRVDWDPAF